MVARAPLPEEKAASREADAVAYIRPGVVCSYRSSNARSVVRQRLLASAATTLLAVDLPLDGSRLAACPLVPGVEHSKPVHRWFPLPSAFTLATSPLPAFSTPAAWGRYRCRKDVVAKSVVSGVGFTGESSEDIAAGARRRRKAGSAVSRWQCKRINTAPRGEEISSFEISAAGLQQSRTRQIQTDSGTPRLSPQPPCR